MDAFRAPEVPERLLLGADGAGGGLATLLAETGLDDEDAGCTSPRSASRAP